MPSLVREIPAAPSAIALMHFSNRLTFETDCSDVYSSQEAGEVDFVWSMCAGRWRSSVVMCRARSTFRPAC
jgi:hypothetical protein